MPPGRDAMHPVAGDEIRACLQGGAICGCSWVAAGRSGFRSGAWPASGQA